MAKERKNAKRKNTAKRKPAPRRNVARHHKAKPPKMRRLSNAGTGWIKATRVKIVKKRGKPAQVLIQKPRRARRK